MFCKTFAFFFAVIICITSKFRRNFQDFDGKIIYHTEILSKMSSWPRSQ